MVATKKKYLNPFYVLLVIVGVAFCLTACAYGLMTVQALHPDAAARDGAHPLIAWVDEYGARAMLVELVLLGVCTAAAMFTDEFWARRARATGAAGRAALGESSRTMPD